MAKIKVTKLKGVQPIVVPSLKFLPPLKNVKIGKLQNRKKDEGAKNKNV